MARLYLFAEGQTEQTFANNLLKPHLAPKRRAQDLFRIVGWVSSCRAI